ncbi:MAG: hypothetical protein M1820_006086 [Bogoriella megaspora]|nr:MAG: hypothetical protein M1820_006086 [Bogoriella megaspora]
MVEIVKNRVVRLYGGSPEATGSGEVSEVLPSTSHLEDDPARGPHSPEQAPVLSATQRQPASAWMMDLDKLPKRFRGWSRRDSSPPPVVGLTLARCSGALFGKTVGCASVRRPLTAAAT